MDKISATSKRCLITFGSFLWDWQKGWDGTTELSLISQGIRGNLGLEHDRNYDGMPGLETSNLKETACMDWSWNRVLHTWDKKCLLDFAFKIKYASLQLYGGIHKQVFFIKIDRHIKPVWNNDCQQPTPN